MDAMRRVTKSAAVATLLLFAFCSVSAQDEHRAKGVSNSPSRHATESQARAQYYPLNDDDRLSVIAAALDTRERNDESDCSHFVHAIYEQAGFTYTYAPSSDLYLGVDGFERIKKPEPGDLIVWRGHVGIVIKPSRHIFFSYLSSGPGIDDYTSRYWKRRGKARFYRYVIARPSTQPTPHLVRTNRIRTGSVSPNNNP
jgi:hypothetical protein